MEKPSYSEDIRDSKFLNALAEAFRIQEAILDTTELAIISISADGQITSFNKSAETLLGYRAEEVIGKNNPLIFHDLDEVVRAAEKISNELGISMEPVFDVLTIKARNSNKPYRERWTMVRKDGSRFPALLSVAPLMDDEGHVNGYVGIAEDQTETHETKSLVKANENKFRTLAENIPGAVYLCHNDADYSIIYLNDHIEAITGYSVEDFYAKKITFPKLYHSDDEAGVVQKVNDAVEKKERFHITYRLRHKSGEWRWIDEVGIGVYENGHLKMLEGFLTDITAQKLAEENFRKISDENNRVFNNAVVLNVVSGLDGFFKRVSSSWTTVLGWTAEELQSKPFIDFVHPEDIEATINALHHLNRGHNLATFENRYLCKNGDYRWLLWSSAPDLKQEVIYASAIDITERRKSEEELLLSKKNLEIAALKLQEQNKALDEFAHIISHNLRSPIGNIRALINLLDENSGIQDYKLIFYKLKNLSQNLSETMDDIMETLKVKTNTDIEKNEIRFKEILDKVVQSLEGDLIMAAASVTYDFNQAPAIQYPKAYLESIFQNLLSNAIKYRSAERRPAIHFSSAKVEGITELRVRDNGQGIDLEKFGDKLFGLHKTFHVHEQARGVGLFLIKTQIESMGGSIKAESEVDKGTTFTIRFA